MALCVLKLTIVQRPPAPLSFVRLHDSQRCQMIRLKCLLIDIASLSNQIQLILPSKASNFLGWKTLKFLFQRSMFGFQMFQQCQMFYTQQLVLLERATHCAFKSVGVKPYVICHLLHVFFSLVQLAIVPCKTLAFLIHTSAGIKWGMVSKDTQTRCICHLRTVCSFDRRRKHT